MLSLQWSVLAVCVVAASAQFHVGSESQCEPRTGGTGTCVVISACPELLELLRGGSLTPAVVARLRQAQCGFEGNSPKVCCPTTQLTEAPVTWATASQTSPPTPAATQSPAVNVQNHFVSALPDPPVCGFSNASMGRVVNGVNASLGDFPWMALLGYHSRYSDGPRWLCGGSLVTQRHVLTAAHCIHSRDDLYLVRLGELDTARDDEGATPVDVNIRTRIEHPQYNPKSITDDIGVLVLARDVTFTHLIQPICLPAAAELRARSFEKHNPIIAGWGDVQYHGPSATILQALQLPVVTNEYCRRAYSAYKTQIIDGRVLCAGYERGGRDACQGDSGGPLMQPIWDSSVYKTYFYQIGVVSYGRKCAEAGFPGVYTRVTHFMPWLYETLLGRSLE